MGSRFTNKAAKGRFFFTCVFIIVLLGIVYLYLMYAQENYKNSKWAEKRCLSELSSVKYQLDVVTDYKAHVEKMLSESQKAHNSDKDKFKDVAESCITMKQQSLLCQNQFDDLQNECKKVRQTSNKEKLEAVKLMNQVQDEIKKKDQAQHTIDELFAEIDQLRRNNKFLEDKSKLNKANSENNLQFMFGNNDKKLTTGRNFSHLNEILPGLYEVGNNFGNSDKTFAQAKKLQDDNIKNSNVEIVLDKSSNQVPPGFAPVLRVVENAENVNLQKPPDVNIEKIAPNKMEDYNDQKVHNINNIDDRDLEVVGALPNAKDNVMLEENEILNVPLEHEKHPLGDEANNANEANRPAQEDDDEGEEYAA